MNRYTKRKSGKSKQRKAPFFSFFRYDSNNPYAVLALLPQHVCRLYKYYRQRKTPLCAYWFTRSPKNNYALAAVVKREINTGNVPQKSPCVRSEQYRHVLSACSGDNIVNKLPLVKQYFVLHYKNYKPTSRFEHTITVLFYRKHTVERQLDSEAYRTNKIQTFDYTRFCASLSY